MCGDGYKRLHTCNNILFWIFSSYFISSLLLNWISFSRWKRKLHYVDNIFTIFFSKKNNKFRRFCSPPVRIQSSLNSKLILTGPPIFDENSPHKPRKANDKAWHQWMDLVPRILFLFTFISIFYRFSHRIFKKLELIKTGCC